MTESHTVIDLRGVVKRFGRTRALDGFDLHVEQGEIAGFLGPNGAGKSTTIRILLGILRADAGSASVLGLDPWADAVELHRRLAYVPGDVNLWPNLSGGEIVDFLVDLRDRGSTRSSEYRRRRDELLERFQLDPRKRARTYSKGNRQKVALVAALACDAELFVFDEPTSGLDPLMENVFVDALRALREDGRTVLLSSHILGEVENACDTVTIIRSGATVEAGRLSDLRHLSRSVVSARVDDAAAATLAELEGVHEFRRTASTVEFTVDGAHIGAVLRTLADAGADDVVIAPPSLEQRFLEHYGAGTGDASGDAGARR